MLVLRRTAKCSILSLSLENLDDGVGDGTEKLLEKGGGEVGRRDLRRVACSPNLDSGRQSAREGGRSDVKCKSIMANHSEAL